MTSKDEFARRTPLKPTQANRTQMLGILIEGAVAAERRVLLDRIEKEVKEAEAHYRVVSGSTYTFSPLNLEQTAAVEQFRDYILAALDRIRKEG